MHVFAWEIPTSASLLTFDAELRTWGACGTLLLAYVLLKVPRLITQRSGDEWLLITEASMTVIGLLQLTYIAGRASTSEVSFPPSGQLIFWMCAVALTVMLVVQMYFSMRLAERTGEYGIMPPH
jgi:hypothetical protein